MDSNVEVLNISICTVDGDNRILLQSPLVAHDLQNRKIFVCGNLITKEPAVLSILTYKEKTDNLIHMNLPSVKYSPGLFSEEILVTPYTTGEYFIIIYRGRSVIAEQKFELK